MEFWELVDCGPKKLNFESDVEHILDIVSN